MDRRRRSTLARWRPTTRPSRMRGDPERLELGNYEGVPHLDTPIITEPKLASYALRNAVREMERRLKVLAEKGVRNIGQYNALFDGQTPSLFEDASEHKPLP